MITMDEARQIAAKRLSDISGCSEFTNAYVFFNPGSEDSDGGWDAPAVVLKEDGKCCAFADYIERYGGGKPIGTTVYFRNDSHNERSRK